MHALRTEHLAVMHTILKYKKGAPIQGIFQIYNGHLNVEA